jgi:hypothetical protein
MENKTNIICIGKSASMMADVLIKNKIESVDCICISISDSDKLSITAESNKPSSRQLQFDPATLDAISKKLMGIDGGDIMRMIINNSK